MCFGHDVRRHSHQPKDAVTGEQTGPERTNAIYERSEWRSTCWSLWNQSTMRALGFIAQEACQ
jgi:hypothetical protein